MFWTGRDTPEEVRALGVRCGQLGIPGEMALSAAAADEWKFRLSQAGLTICTIFASYIGEDYADIPTVGRTVGFVPPGTRAARERRTEEVVEFAARLGVGSFACHIGCLPREDGEIRDLVRRVCDRCAAHGMTFALETGQEPAEALLRFLDAVDRPNLGINFDPANMILYGTGDPIAALRRVAPGVLSVHCKDGVPPAAPGALGTECPLGQGHVGIESFVRTLAACGYRGQLHIEREGVDHDRWLRDVSDGIQLVSQAAQLR